MAEPGLGRRHEATDNVRKTIAASPLMPGANLLLGIAFTQMHRGDEAVAAFRRETELDPKNAQARMVNRLRQTEGISIRCVGACFRARA